MLRRRLALAATLGASFALLAFGRGCGHREGCLAGDDGTCVPASPCLALTPATCGDRSVRGRWLGGAAERAKGLDALAARGDLLLENGSIALVLDAIGSPHYLAPSGGSLLDLVPKGTTRGEDDLNEVTQVVGILPGDAVHYTRMDLEDHAPDYVAAILRGALDGRPRTTVVTRYELRPCEAGVRVRTELYHGGRDPETFFLSDGFYWGGREAAALSPAPGRGFAHPKLDLLKIDEAFVDQPFLASRSQRPEGASYAVVACDRRSISGFHSDVVSAVGVPRAVVMPGDSLAYERIFLVGEGLGAASATSLAIDARQRLFSEQAVTVRGQIVVGGALASSDQQITVLLTQPTGSGPIVWSEAIVRDDGTFVARMPARGKFEVVPHAFGRPLATHVPFETKGTDVGLPTITLERPGAVEVVVTDPSGAPLVSEVVLTPTGATTEADVRGSLYGAFDVDHCAPWLGPPHGGSPACNRALVDRTGRVRFYAPTGSYWVYATAGPFAQIARARVDVAPGKDAKIALRIATIPDLVPPGVLSGDFHVHGGASFDSSLPDRDRALSFAASGVDVIAATDHDVVTTYEKALRDAGVSSRVRVLPGAETTGHILFYRPPGSSVPKVVGHYNFWPLRHDADLPRNGLPWDEKVEPGALFDRVAPSFVGSGVIQFNHPLASASFGRDEGFVTAAGYDWRKPLPGVAENTGGGQLRRSFGGRSALDYHAQEVMNGTSTRQAIDYRNFWYSLLGQGILRAGTANSDSHTLAVEVVGYPRNLVFGRHALPTLDVEAFDADVRAGRMVGTNGPVIVASVGGRGPSIEPFAPGAGATLSLEVRAAPWIPVEEIRVVVNGKIARRIDGAAIARPADPFGTAGAVRYTGAIALDELLAGLEPGADAWIVIEAGLPRFLAADLDDDGFVDTTDNDGNGVVDDRDKDGRDDDHRYVEPARPAETDPRFHAHIIAPGHWATAFTNPLLIDRGAAGWTGPGIVR